MLLKSLYATYILNCCLNESSIRNTISKGEIWWRLSKFSRVKVEFELNTTKAVPQIVCNSNPASTRENLTTSSQIPQMHKS